MVTDFQGGLVRVVDMETGNTETLISGLANPQFLAFDSMNRKMLISLKSQVIEYDFQTKDLVEIAGGGSGEVVDFNEVAYVTNEIICVTDYLNKKVRVINRAINSVAFICTGSTMRVDGSVLTCSFNNIHRLHIHNGYIYIGEDGAIRMLPSKFCVKNSIKFTAIAQ
jgi:hypothetical protein